MIENLLVAILLLRSYIAFDLFSSLIFLSFLLFSVHSI